MRTTHLLGLALIDLDSALLLGTVEDVLLDLAHLRLLAVTLKAGEDRVPLPPVWAGQIKEIGEDAITFTSGQPASPDLVLNQHTAKLSDVINNCVVTSESRAVRGKLLDFEIDYPAWTISAFIIEESGPFLSIKTITPSPDLSFEPINSAEFEHMVSLNDN